MTPIDDLRALLDQAPAPWILEEADSGGVIVNADGEPLAASRYDKPYSRYFGEVVVALRNKADDLIAVAEAAANPRLLLLEWHPEANEEENRSIYEAAQQLRRALAGLAEEEGARDRD